MFSAKQTHQYILRTACCLMLASRVLMHAPCVLAEDQDTSGESQEASNPKDNMHGALSEGSSFLQVIEKEGIGKRFVLTIGAAELSAEERMLGMIQQNMQTDWHVKLTPLATRENTRLREVFQLHLIQVAR